MRGVETSFSGLGPLNKIGKCLLKEYLRENLKTALKVHIMKLLESALSEISLISQLFVHILK